MQIKKRLGFMNTLVIRAFQASIFMVKCGLCMRKKSPDYLRSLLEKAPAAWALIRANEIRALDKVTFKHPILDVGCGDGVVVKVLMSNRKEKFDWGIDLSQREIDKANKLGVYKNCKVANVYALPFRDGMFLTVFSNSVIEHIPNLEKAVSEMSRVLKKDGSLILTVPSPYLEKYLLGTTLLGPWYGKLFNKLFKHHNLYTHNGWEKIFKKHSLKLVFHHYYHTRAMIRVHEILSYLSLPAHLAKLFVGYWPIFPKVRRLLVVPWLRQLLYKFYIKDVEKDEGGSLLLVAKKFE